MDLRRAREIMESHDTIGVRYLNRPIWIESLNENDQTAQISFIDARGEAVVAVNKLAE